jgi:hypothetical protein
MTRCRPGADTKRQSTTGPAQYAYRASVVFTQRTIATRENDLFAQEQTANRHLPTMLW